MSSSEFPGHLLPRRRFVQLTAIAAGGIAAGYFNIPASAASTSDEYKMANNKTTQTPRFAYVGSRTTKERNARGVGITVYRYAPETGACTLVQTLNDLVNPSFLTFDHTQSHLYCVHGDQSEVSSFAIDSKSGELTKLNTVATQGKNPVHLSVDPTNKFLAVANYATGSFALFPIQEDGSLGGSSHVEPLPGEAGPHKVEQSSSHPHMIPFDPSGHFLMIPDKGLDGIFVYRVRNNNAKLDATQVSMIKAREGSGPRHIVFTPDARHAYVVNELDSSVTEYAYEAEQGSLTAKEILPTLPSKFTGNSRAAAIVMAPSGKYLYVSNRGHDSVATFEIDETGALLAKGHTLSQGRKPRFMNLTPDGSRLFVANEETDNIVTFDVDRNSGGLTENGHVIKTGSPVCMIFKTT
ncbi:lactonase family protein [Pseudomonas sp. N-137]|uniref:lactonase family protein n=1 Tax=Pseudomonas sp. N-137 TaxID=3108452 RepID=UPI002ADEF2DD|nr:lactonase family protein [Pseudomonas sp. N-137]MEA1028050.1 lactonase family protein [Pseudomonas sp. N-137]